MARTGQYKGLAQKAIDILFNVKEDNKTHKYYYLIGYGYFNLWKNDIALEMINRAIDLSGTHPIYFHSYSKVKNKIVDVIAKNKYFSQLKKAKYKMNTA